MLIISRCQYFYMNILIIKTVLVILIYIAWSTEVEDALGI